MEIALTQGKKAIINDADAALILSHKWFAMQTKPGKWYAATKIQRKLVPMHRLITGHAMTDHRDGNGLDNRRHNLRGCTNQQNQFNRRKQASTSRYKGVCWDKRSGRWIAQLQKDGKHRHIGYFADEEAAAAAYRATAKELFGEFASF